MNTIGIDIVSVGRFDAVTAEDFLAWNHVFAEEEWNYCFGYPDPASHLAGTFAAKEAVMKALGGFVMKRYLSILIRRDHDGKPYAAIETENTRTVDISVGHDGGCAVAVAIVTG